MRWSEAALLVVAVLALAGWLLWRQASRIDQLHRKVVATRTALDHQLIRRAGASVDLAASHLLDPASAVVLAQAGYGVIDALPDQTEPAHWTLTSPISAARQQQESELSAALREVLPDAAAVAAVQADPIGRQVVGALAAAWSRATLARRFHNLAVAEARASRRHWWARLLRLAGNAPLPQTLELDDAMPPALLAIAARPGGQEP